MRPFYSHKQTAQVLRWMIIPPALGLLAAGHLNDKALLFLPLALALVGTGWVFSPHGRGFENGTYVVFRSRLMAQDH